MVATCQKTLTEEFSGFSYPKCSSLVGLVLCSHQKGDIACMHGVEDHQLL